MVSKSEFEFSVLRSSLSRGKYGFLFGSDIVNPLLKRGRDRRPNYVNVVVWSALRLVSGGNINMVPDFYSWSQLLLNSLQQGLF